MFLTRRKFHFEAYNKFCFIALAIFIRLFLSLSLSLCFRFTRCLFFSRYATARRRILSFIPCPFFSHLLSLFHSSCDASFCCMCVYMYMVCACVCVHMLAHAHACVYLCVCDALFTIGFSRRRSKRSYLTRHFMGALYCCRWSRTHEIAYTQECWARSTMMIIGFLLCDLV